jgi:hypothetical protein
MNHSILPVCAVLAFVAACGSGRAAEPEEHEQQAPLVECTSYEQELRACSATVGGPTIAADTLAATLSQSDEAARLHMESACARDRLRLRASCK